jgi:hypothetical protein
VEIFAPHQGEVFMEGQDIGICALSQNFTDAVTQVEFFAGTTLIGVQTNHSTLWGGWSTAQPSCIIWSNATAGGYALTAVSTDLAGNSVTSAPVDITVATSLPPVVRILSPFYGQRFYAPANIEVCAGAFSPGGSISQVEFFNGTTSLGVMTAGTPVTNELGQVETSYCFDWSNIVAGTYSLTAVATDNTGNSNTSFAVEIAVIPPPAPLVKIIYPRNGAQFLAPANIFIAATTRYFTNPIANVQFMADTKVLGVVTNSTWPTFAWKNVAVGSYSLTAIATDSTGASVTSAPVAITVSTNRPSLWFGSSTGHDF